jgi:ribosomal protein S18 acetylase RimI-like enzyme
MDAPTIRAATPFDVPALSELAKRTWSDAFGDSVGAEDRAVELARTRSEAYFLDALTESTILVAEDKSGALVGYVQFGDVDIPEVDVRPADQALHRLYVDTAWQGSGLGRMLTDAALAHPRLARVDRIYLTVWEQNERALRLYETFGFRTVGRTTFTIGVGEIAEDLVMVLDRVG